MAMKCKSCGGQPGSKLWPDHNRYYSLTESYDRNLGDHAERLMVDAGVFCSWRCVADYAIALDSREASP